MPHDNSRSETQRTESKSGESTRSERARVEKVAGAMNAPFGEMGARSVTAGLRLQKEMLSLFSEMGREWVERAASQTELAMQLPNKLTSARSMPDVFSAYQEWLGEWMNMVGEDSRRLVSDGRKFIDAGVRCFAETTPAAGETMRTG